MKAESYKNKEFLSTDACKLFQQQYSLEVADNLGRCSKFLDSKRALFYFSWLPTSRQSSHLIYIFKIIRTLQNLGYTCDVLVTGFELSHHRGLNFYLSKTSDELKHLFDTLANSVAGLEFGSVNFEFLIDSDFDGNVSYERFKSLSLGYFSNYCLNDNSLILMTSGNIACKTVDSLVGSFKGKKLVVMTNVADNLTRFCGWVDYILCPSKASNVMNRVKNYGYKASQIIEYINVPAPFHWASNGNNVKETLRGVEWERFKSYSNVLLVCSARMDKEMLNEYCKYLQQMSFDNETLVIVVGAKNKDADHVFAGSSFNYKNVEWVDDIYAFFGELTNHFNVTFLAIDSSGGNTIANAVLQSCTVVIPQESDASNFVIDSWKYESHKDFIELVERHIDDAEYRASSIAEQRKYLEELALKNQELLVSL